MASILTIAEHRNGLLRKVSFEMIGAARDIADKIDGTVETVIIGKDVENLVSELGHYGAQKVYVAEHDRLAHYTPEGYTNSLAQIIGKVQPTMVFIPASAMGKDLCGRLAAKLDVGVAPDCTALEVNESGRLTATRPMYAGRVIAKVAINSDPQIASLRPNIFKALEKDESKSANMEKIDVDPGNIRASLVEFQETAGGKVELTEAEIIVSGGRGIKEAEHFALIEALADKLGAAAGASRAIVDAGWVPHDIQVGQTGKVVNPSLYFAVGISGAIQHLAGMQNSKVIVAINKDPEAPIFKVADYGIVDDLFKIMPVLTEKIG